MNSTRSLKIIVAILIFSATGFGKSDLNSDHALLRYFCSDTTYLEYMRKLIQTGANPNAENLFGFTNLMVACGDRYLKDISLLIDCGATVNQKNRNNWTALSYMVSYCGQEYKNKVLQILLDKGADVNVHNCNGETALMLASAITSTAVSKGHSSGWLNPDGTICPTLKSNQPAQLQIFLAQGVPKYDAKITMKMLLDKGADVNAVDDNGSTALSIACLAGNLEGAKMLLEKGADVNIANQYNETPLMYASGHGHIEIVRALLDKGAKVNVKAKHGETALYLAATAGHTDLIKLLELAGAQK